jgi:hypothetical protein
MAQVRGTIKFGDRNLVENVSIELEEATEEGLQKWGGSFTLPAGGYVQPAASYNLVLEDNRSGNIFIIKVLPKENGAEVQFKGKGSLS